MARSTDPASAPVMDTIGADLEFSIQNLISATNMLFNSLIDASTNFNEEGHHVKELFNIDAPVTILVKKIEHLMMREG